MGVVAPGRPAMHMLCAAAVMEVIGVAVGNTRTLPHGWQMVGFGLQVALASAVAARIWNRSHAGSSMQPRAI